MKRSFKRLLISLTTIVVLLIVVYNLYISSMTEDHIILVESYIIELSIKMDETFLDSQDDYRIKFSLKTNPNKNVYLEIDDCMSRCWVISVSKKSKKQILLHGCDMNSQLIYHINLNNNSYYQLDSMPKGYILIDTLTNLYVDEQLPRNYHY